MIWKHDKITVDAGVCLSQASFWHGGGGGGPRIYRQILFSIMPEFFEGYSFMFSIIMNNIPMHSFWVEFDSKYALTKGHVFNLPSGSFVR